MIRYEPPASSTWSEKLVSKLQDPKYRHAYMLEGVKTWIARQVRALREQRGWSQDDLGSKTGKPQPVISRIEDPDYGKLTVKTLLELAAAYDVALLVQFVEWDDWLNRMGDVSVPALQKQSFDPNRLIALAHENVSQPSVQHFISKVLAARGKNVPADVSAIKLRTLGQQNANVPWVYYSQGAFRLETWLESSIHAEMLRAESGQSENVMEGMTVDLDPQIVPQGTGGLAQSVILDIATLLARPQRPSSRQST